MKCAECGLYSDIHGCIHKDKPHWGLCGDMDACPKFEKRCEKLSGGSGGCDCDDKGKDAGDCGSGGGCQDTGCGSGKKCSCDGEDCYDCDTALLPPWVTPFFQTLDRRENETSQEFKIRSLYKSYADNRGTYVDGDIENIETHFDDYSEEVDFDSEVGYFQSRLYVALGIPKSYADVHGTYADDSLRFKEVHFDDTDKEERDRCRARLIAEDHLHDFSFGDYLYVGVL